MTDEPIIVDPANPAPAPTWFSTADAETQGYFQNRGLDKVTPAEAAFAASKAHREAEKLIGAPASELLRMPKDANDQEGITRLRDRLGVPKEAKEYDFSTVKMGDAALDTNLVEKLAPSLIDANVGKDKAPAVAKAVADYLAARDATSVTERENALNVERDALKVNWGSNVEANMLIAKQAAQALGVTPEAVAALEKTVGYAKVMEMFRNIGTKIGEDKFLVNPGQPGSGNLMSADQARATMAERQNDSAWVAKLEAGDKAAVQEFNSLTTLLASSIRR